MENYIDNTKNKYIEHKLKCGVTLQCRPEILQTLPWRANANANSNTSTRSRTSTRNTNRNDIIPIIEQDIQECLRVLPPSVRPLILRTNIWLNESYTYGPISDPKVLKHSTTHHYADWLLNVRDLVSKAQSIEIYNCDEFIQMRMHWNGCGLLLHEYCHLIHQIVLKDGLENERVFDAFGALLESEKYDEVLRRDWAYLDCDSDAAYASINHKEFFSELSVAFWSRGYKDLDEKAERGLINDWMNMEECSPKIMAPDVLRRKSPTGSLSETQTVSDVDILQGVINFITGKSGKAAGHCNKFFPFTRGQLQIFDPETYFELQELWAEIASWEDPLSDSNVSTGCLSSMQFVPLPCMRGAEKTKDTPLGMEYITSLVQRDGYETQVTGSDDYTYANSRHDVPNSVYL